METYESVEEPDEWRTTNTLVLHDDGAFVFSAVSACYAGSVAREVTGAFERRENAIVLHAEASTHSTWHAGESRRAYVDGDTVRVGEIGLFLPLQRVAPTLKKA